MSSPPISTSPSLVNNKEPPRFWVVIPASGVGSRMQAAIPKQYLPLADKTVIEHTLEIFLRDKRIERVVVSVAAGDNHWQNLQVSSHPKISRVAGGAERCHSVLNGLQYLESYAGDNDWVLVHDAVRPCITANLIDQLINELHTDDVGGLLAMPVTETLKKSGAAQRVQECPDRRDYWLAQTPQMFRFGLLTRALNAAIATNELVTDESAAVERLGFAPKLVSGSIDNIKITRADDLSLADFFLHRHQQQVIQG